MSDNKEKLNTTSDTGEAEETVSLWKFTKIIAHYVFLGVMFAACVVIYVGLVGKVDGSSMEPTLHDNDIIVASRNVKDLERGDIVLFTLEDREFAQKGDNMERIKRVIGLPGDVVEIDEETSTVYVNGEALEEDYINVGRSHTSDMTGPVTVPDGYYFVLGDNRGNSVDSRHDRNGLVALNEIKGKMLIRIWPLW